MDEVAERTSPQVVSGTLAFLFTDIAGSTRLWEERPVAMTAALARHDAILREAIDGAGGQLVKTTGDGALAVFPATASAVTAAIHAQVALADEAWGETGPLRVRMGIHAGEAEQRGDDYFGSTINRTARLMAAGHGGQVLLSSAAAALVADRLPAGVTLRDLGEFRLKDIGRPEQVFQVAHPGLASSFPPLTTLDAVAGRLPADSGTFIGREAELADLARELEDPGIQLLTLTGPGGTGKTALAIRVARDVAARYRDGVSFVDLSGARDTHAALLALGRVLGVGEAPDRSLEDQLVDRLRDRQMLVVVDNFEQVTEAASAVAGLLADCSGVRLLVTSREPLRVRAEHVHEVAPLGLPPIVRGPVSATSLKASEAVALFVDRARAVDGDFTLTDDNAEAVADICRRLDGLPLAIELAAARLRLFSPETLRARLTSRLEVLRSASRDLPARHQTLRATIEWSVQLLEADEQRLFELIAVFADADIAGVEAVARTVQGLEDLDVVDVLASLLEKSLLRRQDAPGGEPRLSMLETIRELAAERLEATGRGQQARRAHAAYYTDLATRLRRELDTPDRDRAMRALVSEAGNLRIAVREWAAIGEVAELTRIADALLVLNEARGWYHDTVELTTTLLTVLAATPTTPELAGREIALRMTLAKAILATQGFTAEAEQAFASAVERFEVGRELRQHYSVLRGLANLYMLRGAAGEARRLGERILEIAAAEDDPSMAIDGHLVLGTTMAFVGEVRPGLDHLEAAIALFSDASTRPVRARIGNDSRVACLTTSGFVLWLLGRQDSAVARADAAIELAHRLDHPFTTAYAFFHSGLLHLWRHEPEVVLDRAIRLLEVADTHDLRVWLAIGHCLQGAAQTLLGQAEQGLAGVRSGIDEYRGMVTPPVFWPLLLELDAGTSGAAGRAEEGLVPIAAAIELVGPGSTFLLLAEMELVRGDLLAATGGPAMAAWQDALASARRIGVPMSELRALTRLVGSASGEDRAALAKELQTVLTGLSEGLGTADLREARAVMADAG